MRKKHFFFFSLLLAIGHATFLGSANADFAVGYGYGGESCGKMIDYVNDYDNGHLYKVIYTQWIAGFAVGINLAGNKSDCYLTDEKGLYHYVLQQCNLDASQPPATILFRRAKENGCF
jgi:hypothetical protein